MKSSSTAETSSDAGAQDRDVPSTSRCSASGKVKFTSEADAKRAHKHASYRVQGYRCAACGAWHVGNPQKRQARPGLKLVPPRRRSETPPPAKLTPSYEMMEYEYMSEGDFCDALQHWLTFDAAGLVYGLDGTHWDDHARGDPAAFRAQGWPVAQTLAEMTALGYELSLKRGALVAKALGLRNARGR